MHESLSGRHGSGGRTGRADWHSRMFRTIYFVLTLATGMMVGIVVTLQLLSYLRITGAMFSLRNPGHGAPLVNRGMGDEELLWRASMAPRRPGLPIPRTPKVAFMFLTVGPLPLSPLWEKFFKGHEDQYSIYVHSLPGYEPDAAPSSVFFGRHITSQASKWGDISMCDAERRLLANALLDQDNERFILLSESCAPLWNFTFTYNYLINSKQSFVSVFDDPSSVGRGRYDSRMLPEVTIDQWRKGAQWFEVDRELAVHIVSDVKYYPKFRDFCQPVCYVDEHYIPTMLFIEFKEKVAMRSVTAVDWGNGGSHPEEFGKDNAEEFYKRIRSGRDCVYNGEPGHICYMFARKFLPDSLPTLLAHSNFREIK
ncbi:hypothetical protein M758_11G124700 [Ceratodon purpureus]|nr:hypothetical protein M758_11G124700 [Ceratodon purpureus]